jgi:hypothetical protein
MSKPITFDVSELIGKVDALKAVQLPYAGRRALADFGRYIKEFHAREMAGTFDRPVPLTTRSVYWRQNGLELSVRVNDTATKGTPPSAYLQPQVIEPGAGRKPVKVTRFSGALRRKGLTYGIAVPNLESAAASGQLTAYGNLKPAAYVKALGGLGALEMAGKSRGRNGRYFVIGPERQRSHLPPGIYRAEGRSSLSQLFHLMEQPPTVTPRWDFRGLTIAEAEDQLPVRLAGWLERALV